MTTPYFDSSPLRPGHAITDAYSLEVTARDMPALAAAAPLIPPATTIAIAHLSSQSDESRLAAARAVRDLGFEPMLHLSARRIASAGTLRDFLERAVADAGVERCFVIAGDPSTPHGPYADSSALIDTGLFERSGMRVIGVAGHLEAHPVMREGEAWAALESKCRNIEERGMASLVVTQFSFEADAMLGWLETLRARGLHCPVRVGIPGPTDIVTLARYAARCGVAASASVLARYGMATGRLLGMSGPDRLVDDLDSGLTRAHGVVHLHCYPFGSVARSAQWMSQYRARMNARQALPSQAKPLPRSRRK